MNQMTTVDRCCSYLLSVTRLFSEFVMYNSIYLGCEVAKNQPAACSP